MFFGTGQANWLALFYIFISGAYTSPCRCLQNVSNLAVFALSIATKRFRCRVVRVSEK